MFPLFLSLLPSLIASAYLYPMENKALSTRQQQQHWGLHSPHMTRESDLVETPLAHVRLAIVSAYAHILL